MIEKFRLPVGESYDDVNDIMRNNYLIGKKQAKACAAKCVTEILKVVHKIHIADSGRDYSEAITSELNEVLNHINANQ